MDMRVPQIPMLVYLLANLGPEACSNQLPRYILFKGQARRSYRGGGRSRDYRHTRTGRTCEINDPIPMDERVSRGWRTGLPLLSV